MTGMDARRGDPGETYMAVARASAKRHRGGISTSVMSYNITLRCGCVVYVACHPQSGVAHTRVLECRGQLCLVRKHEVGMRLALAELLLDEGEGDRPSPLFVHGGGRRVPA
jgi:hypothetical protein